MQDTQKLLLVEVLLLWVWACSLDGMQPAELLCSICQDKLGAEYVTTSCGHMFHRECLRAWLQFRRAEGKMSFCPNCRSSHVLELPPILPIPVLSEMPQLSSSLPPSRPVLRDWVAIVLGRRRSAESENVPGGTVPPS